MSVKNFEEVAQIRSGEIVCIITEHVPSKRRSFMLAKEYAKGGQVARTSFMAEKHIEDVLTLLNQVQSRL